jgi:hypothetical protein
MQCSLDSYSARPSCAVLVKMCGGGADARMQAVVAGCQPSSSHNQRICTTGRTTALDWLRRLQTFSEGTSVSVAER